MTTQKFDHPLANALSIAVTLKIAEFENDSYVPTEEDMSEASTFATTLGEKGDILLYGSKKKGEVADLFNRLARAITILSYCPGGIDIFGCHFEANIWK